MIAPYGGRLVERRLTGVAAMDAAAEAVVLPRIDLTERARSDLALLACGALSPLTGFMAEADYASVLERMSLASGLPWTIPITLAVDRGTAARLGSGARVALAAPGGRALAILTVDSIHARDRHREAQLVYGTASEAHPGVAALQREAGDVLLGGSVDVFGDPDPTGFGELHRSPSQTREDFRARGWRTVVGFQTRNPIHRAHEYLQKSALEIVDGMLLHPLVGETKSDDVPAEVRMQCYHALVRHYFPPGRVVLSVLPAAMRYAGPREAVFHAIIRRNYGCTHFIVGRDHAGVGDYYDTYAAQQIFDTIDADLLGIQPLRFEHAFFCSRCQQMATLRTCPHEPSHHVHLSGTRVRELLARGERPPAEFSRPEVADVLVRAFAAGFQTSEVAHG